jgi:hypothetical protein
VKPRAIDRDEMNRARIAGLVYTLVFATGMTALLARGSAVGAAAGGIAGLLYIVVTVLFYGLFKPVNQPVSLIAAAVSLLGIAVGPLLRVNPLPLFGIYCLLIGYLIIRSTYVPRVLGVLMAIGGVGWLTFVSPSLANQLSPYNFVPGMIGEGALTVWLVIAGVGPTPALREAPR